MVTVDVVGAVNIAAVDADVDGAVDAGCVDYSVDVVGVVVVVLNEHDSGM